MISMEEQFKIITKGAASRIQEEELKSKLDQSIKSNTPLIVKLGLDPSAPDIHLGHAVVLRKIKQIQDLGHKAIIVIGDFTGRIGDPTGKSKARKALTSQQVLDNAKTYCDQIFKILDKDKTEVRFNSEWLSELNFEEIIKLSSSTTVARMLEREDFHVRYKNNSPIGLHEFFYPLMQAYDSVVLGADIELGGIDQTFNILMGRNLQKSMGQQPQIALFLPLLEGLDGVEKMSKSLGNYIGIYEPAEVMFKKLMEIPDSLILKYYELATDEHPDTIAIIMEQLNNGTNPRDIKYQLALTITSLYHSQEEVVKATEYYDAAFHNKSIPDIMPELLIDWENDKLVDILPLLVQEGYSQSNSELRRVIKQGGLQINMEKTDDLETVLYQGDILKIGKKYFLRIIK